MLLESRALAGRKRNGLTLSAFGAGSPASEEDEEDERPQGKMQAEAAAGGSGAVAGAAAASSAGSSSPSPNGSLLGTSCGSNSASRQCATDFSIAAIMARDSRAAAAAAAVHAGQQRLAGPRPQQLGESDPADKEPPARAGNSGPAAISAKADAAIDKR
ncbi:glycine-rich protein 1-like [Nasonia vitripennis]|uniref:Uncharacterized protein n=1 Tax=Nasonia vitripennis TaxID=7425 RepID=A0A7M7PZP8_NASVI|nr:glycine-rich protein 1-like [Nasonia vitripennis]